MMMTPAHQVFLQHPLCLVPSISIITHYTQSASSLHDSTCPNHHNLPFLIIKLTGSNPKISQLCTFLTFFVWHAYLSDIHHSQSHETWKPIYPLNYLLPTKTNKTSYYNNFLKIVNLLKFKRNYTAVSIFWVLFISDVQHVTDFIFDTITKCSAEL